MNSIRPLITITIVVVVGAFLYVKINEGPVRPLSGGSDAWPSQSPEGVPPLAVTSEAASQSSSPAPPWSATTPTTEPTTEPATRADADIGAQPPANPVVPPIPELPAATPPSQPAAPTTASAPLPTDLPANIPTARYPGEPAPSGAVSHGDVASSMAMPSNSAPPAAVATNESSAERQPVTPEEANDFDVAANSLSSAPLAGQDNPLRQSPPPSAGDRYATAVTPSAAIGVAAPTAATSTSFAASWPTIQAVLDRGELAEAHQMLSRWHNDPSLTPTDAELVDKLLSQLAGTVVYSTEHQLEPAYIVKPGDTLETIATQYNVPWQLLAKINGIANADQVQLGQALKVVRGPFSAVVDLGRKQLTLMVDDRYAGKFPVTVPSAAAVSEGQWLVDQKTVNPSATMAQSAYAPAPATVDRAIVLRGEPSAGPAAAAQTLTIASGGAAGNATATPPAISVSPQDAEELSDILSIGSRVVIRR